MLRAAVVLAAAALTATARRARCRAAPGPPADIVVGPGGGDGSISVSWERIAAPRVQYYQVFRQIDPAAFELVAVVADEPVPDLPAHRRRFIDQEQYEARCYTVNAVGASGAAGPLGAVVCGSHVFTPSTA